MNIKGELDLSFGEGGIEVRRVVELDELAAALDLLGLGDPLTRRVLVARPRPEGAIRGDGKVLRLVIDEDQAAELTDALPVGVQEGVELAQIEPA